MSHVSRTRLTVQEYLEIERDSRTKHEYYQGEMYAMAGGTAAHNLITLNLAMDFRQAVATNGCQVFAMDIRVLVEKNGLFTYPDVVVACPPIQFRDDHRDTLLNPRLIVEVESKSTRDYDRGAKFDLYRDIESFEQYLLVSQTAHRVLSFTRQPSSFAWLMQPYESLNSSVRLDAWNADISLSNIYEGIQLTIEEDNVRRAQS